MRFVTLLAVVALLVASAYAAPYTSNEQPLKISTHDPRPYPPTGEAGGETFATSVDMVALPFSDTGNMWDYADDIDFGYGTSPDCVYHYTPDFDGCVTVDMCGSNYDSMLWIVDATATTILFWNDDGVDCDAYQSALSWMPVYNGVLYYYVLDGYDGSAGPYAIDVFQIDCPPAPECPAGAQLEGEPCSPLNYEDHLNGGWNSTPPIYQPIDCALDGQVVVCGTTFSYNVDPDAVYRDTDCFSMVDQTETTTMTFTSYYESSGSLYIYWEDGLGGYDIPFYTHLGSRELGTLTAELDISMGTWGIFQSKNGWDGTYYPCEDPEVWPYVLTIDGYTCPATPTETDTWGGVKNLFK